MKKLILSLSIVSLSLITYSQAIVENAIIPVTVNLNAIMRLSVTSGGSIEFSFNTIADYTSGFANTDRYDTHFTVSSSIDFDVTLAAEDGTFVGVDNSAHNLPLNFVAFELTETGSGADVTNWDLIAGWNDLSNTAQDIITSVAGAGAGDGAKNSFILNWECGTTNTGGGSILEAAGIAPDRYATNVLLVLEAH